jgi:hypothetical protein
VVDHGYHNWCEDQWKDTFAKGGTISGHRIESIIQVDNIVAERRSNDLSFLLDRWCADARPKAVRINRTHGFHVGPLADGNDGNAIDGLGIRHIADVGRWT